MRQIHRLFKNTFRHSTVRVHQTYCCVRHTSTHCLEGVGDRYNGMTVNVSQLPVSTTLRDFDRILSESLKSWRMEDRGAIWLQVPITYSHLIAAAARHGFLFHHAENQQCLMKLWLPGNKDDNTPRFATHQLGVCGVVLRENTGEFLVVREKKSQQYMFCQNNGNVSWGDDSNGLPIHINPFNTTDLYKENVCKQCRSR